MPLDRTAYYADASTPASIAAITAAMADAEADQVEARSSHTFRPADTAGLAALSGLFTLRADDRAFQVDTGVTYRWNGSAWKAWESDWISYTPTVTAVTSLGTGATLAFQYQYQTGRVRVRGRITLGTSPTINTAPVLTLPFTFATTVRYGFLGYERCFAFDVSAGGTPSPLIARFDGTNYARMTVSTWNGATAADLTATVPFTWAVGDTIDIDVLGDPA